jgi:hypothetical protein
MKKKAIVTLLILLAFSIACAEGGMIMKKSDWLHMTLPGVAGIVSEQTLLSLNINEDVAEYGTLALGAFCIIGYEYYQMNNGGSATKEDIELGLMSLGTGWVFNKAINAVFRKKN